MLPNHSAVLEVRLWNEDVTGWRALPLAGNGKPGVAPGAEARITAAEGYGEATLPLHGSLANFPGLESGRRVEFYARYAHPLTGADTAELVYRGYIATVTPKKVERRRVITVRLYGIWAEMAKARCFKRYANSAALDKNAIFSDLFTKFVQHGRLSDLSLLSLPVGDIPDYVDAYNVPFGEAADKLAQNTGRVVTGGDVETASGKDRARFVPFDDPAVSVKHVLSLPSPQIGSRDREKDASKQATVLYLNGGSMSRGRSNLLAEAVEGNTSFEMPELAGASPAGSLVTNASFEDGVGPLATGWTFAGGASVKTRAEENVSPFSGERYIKLDGVGEKVSQTNNPPFVALVVGQQMVLSARVRRQRDTYAVSGELRVVWLTSGGSTIRTDTVALTPLSTIFDLFSGTFAVPATAAGFRVEAECTSVGGVGFDYALCVDEVLLYPQGSVTQRGWQVRLEGTAHFNVLRWDEDAVSWHGGRCVYADVVSTADGDNQAHLEPFGFNRFTVTGGQTIVAGFVVRVAPGAADADFQLNLSEWKQDGTKRGSDEASFTVSEGDGWVVLSCVRSFAEDAAQGIIYLDFQSDAKAYIDGAFAFDLSAPAVDAALPDRFVEADQFRATLRATELFTVGNAIHDAAADLGDLPQSEDRQEITTLVDAEAYARAYFEKFVPVVERPNLETFGVVQTGDGSTASMWPGEYMRAIGEDGADLLPTPLPLVEKLIKWDGGKLTITPYLQVEPQDPARTVAQIVRQNRLGGRDNRSASGGFNGGGGSSTGGGAATGYSTVEDEGTPLTLRDTLNFLGAGVTVTDNASTGATDVTIPGSGGSGTADYAGAATTISSATTIGAYADAAPVLYVLQTTGFGYTVTLPTSVTGKLLYFSNKLSGSGHSVTLTGNLAPSQPNIVIATGGGVILMGSSSNGWTPVGKFT
jgi:uncharacterized membrane protein YgcG